MSFRLKLAREIGLTATERRLFRRLKTPELIQDFLSNMPCNHEEHGGTCHSARIALELNRAHCLEGAFIACCAFMLHGEPSFIMNLRADRDDDHVVVLFKRQRRWGAISKSNSIWLRWRDPIYATPRELAMSYFHEFAVGARKSLRAASRPFDLSSYDPAYWVTTGKELGCWDMANEIAHARHFSLIPVSQHRALRPRDAFEVKAAMLKEWRLGAGRAGLAMNQRQ